VNLEPTMTPPGPPQDSDVVPRAIRKHGETGLEIDWSDGRTSVLPFRTLRDNCPCASCKEDRGKVTLTLPLAGAGQPGAEPTRLKQVIPMGRYAYSLIWADGHATGIYPFELLRRIGELR
jgi:DUF971 family protein